MPASPPALLAGKVHDRSLYQKARKVSHFNAETVSLERSPKLVKTTKDRHKTTGAKVVGLGSPSLPPQAQENGSIAALITASFQRRCGILSVEAACFSDDACSMIVLIMKANEMVKISSREFRGKVLLLSAVEDPEAWMPLSIVAIGSALHADGFDVKLVDVQVDADWREIVAANIRDCVFFGLTCYTSPSILKVLDAIEIARQVAPDVPIVWGGYHASLAYSGILREKWADFVVRGTGEACAISLARQLARPSGPEGAALREIPNLAYLVGDDLHVAAVRPIGDMNELPALNYDLLNVGSYFSDDRRLISYISSYGCPYQCTFCAEPSFSGRIWRPLDAERVVSDLLRINETLRPTYVYFMDPNFSSNAKRVMQIARLMLERGLRVPMSMNMRVPDIIRLAAHSDLSEMYRAGISLIFIGAESGSDTMLESVKKGQQASDIVEACRLLSAASIESITSFVFDFPGETPSDIDRTFEVLEKLSVLRTNQQTHHFFTPFPSTELFQSLGFANERTQREWANTSTFYGNDLWSGNAKQRKSILKRLINLRNRYPNAIQHFPVLTPLSESKAVRALDASDERAQ